ncbi:MAG: hypothetical protein Q8M22_06550 [Actinomycetota bacterium]|nr:hypothetical protein [Actinomycetota bacterium]
MLTARIHTRLAVSAILAAAVLTACGGGSPSSTAEPDSTIGTTAEPTTVTSPSTAATTSRWDDLLGTIGDDGEVSLELALDAFSLGVAPLPGSEVHRDHADETVPDATSAVAWVLRHFDELSPEQQHAVAVALSPLDTPPPPPTAAVSGLRSTAPAMTLGCYGQVVPTADSPGAEAFRVIVDDSSAEITAKLGGAISMVAPIHLLVDDRDLGISLAYTWADPGDCGQNGLASCTIHLSPEATDAEGSELYGIIAHEVMHCFQFQYLGVAAYEMPAWILEGMPAWAGEDLAGGTTVSTKWWTRYLTTPGRSLYARDYDAIGFYAHLDEVGTDPWSRFVGMLDGFSNEPAFDAAGASSGSFLESWPSSMLRRTDYGRAWDATGPGITIDRATPTPLSVANGSVAEAQVAKVTGGLYDVSLFADLVTFQFDGWARMGAEGGIDQVLSPGVTYCARPGGCICPDGSGPTHDPIDARVVVGLTGGTSNATLSIVGSELDCERRETTTTPELVDRCLVGRWTSTASYIDDTVTGAPVNERGGGAGIVLTIERDGTFTMDFTAATPSSTDLGDGIVLSTQTRGVATGHLTAMDGQVQVIDHDYATSLTTRFSTGGQIAGGTGIGSGTYTCGTASIEMRTPFELGETINSFTALS